MKIQHVITAAAVLALIAGMDAMARGGAGGGGGGGGAGCGGGGGPGGGGPGNRGPGINQRQNWQEDRIEQGIRSGQLTPGEAMKLEQEEKGIRQEERQYKSDGKLTTDERKDLQKDLNQVSKDIYQEKHDTEIRPGVPPNTGASRTPGINMQERRQERRINQGLKSGELTPREAWRLQWGEQRLQRLEQRLKNDGDLTPAERTRLQGYLNFLNARINRAEQKNQAKPPVTTGSK